MNSTRVFSYRRFSSGRQAHGHSLERQVESARRWCHDNGYLLDESLALSDLGVSAYKGDNASRGALSAFLSAVEAGKVPKGSVLLVESLDRLSRAAIPEAVGLLTSIVRSGVRVVSLIDGKEWNNETIDDTTSFLLSVILFSRAHEESSTKAKRVSAAFQRKREAKLPIVSIMHGPGWVKPSANGDGWELDDEKSAVVRKVFQLAASGRGGVAIARLANKEKWPLPWRSRKNSSKCWEHTAISRLLRDRRALGEWQPRRVVEGRLIADGDPVLNYYPAPIEMELWLLVQSSLNGRTGPRRIRGLNADIFSGLLFCSCGERLERKTPSTRGSARYYCLGRVTGLSDCKPVSEKILIERVLSFIGQLEQEAFRSDDKSTDLREKIAIAEAKAADGRERASRIIAALEDGSSSTLLLERLATIEKEIADAERTSLTQKEALMTTPILDQSFGIELADNATEAIADRSAVEKRHKLSTALNSVFDRIVWNGNSFIVKAKSGASFVVMVPPNLLGRAKRRDAGISRKSAAEIKVR